MPSPGGGGLDSPAKPENDELPLDVLVVVVVIMVAFGGWGPGKTF